MEVRPIRGDDVGTVAALVGQLRYEALLGEVEDRVRRIADDPEADILVADAGGSIVGWIHVYGVTWVQLGRFAGVGGMVVADGHRGEGIGSQLLAAAEGWGRDRGYSVIRVRSNAVREEAHAFYQSRGYETEKQLLSFSKTL